MYRLLIIVSCVGTYEAGELRFADPFVSGLRVRGQTLELHADHRQQGWQDA